MSTTNATPPAGATTTPAATAATAPPPPSLRLIAVSVNKPSRAFFNIARKALLEGADAVQLSALESAIPIAIDASFLLTRAAMAEVESIETGQVEVPYYYHTSPPAGVEARTTARKARMTIRLRKTEVFKEYVHDRQAEHGSEGEEELEEY